MGDILDTTRDATLGGAALVVAGVAVVAGLVALVLVARSRRTAAREIAAARSENAELRARLDAVERRTRERPEPETLVPEPLERTERTERIEREAPVEVRATLPAPVFTDMVVRESVIRVASLSHGVRRALRPEQRHRVRFEVRRVTKQARKQRRSELKAALREMRASQRAAAGRAGRAGEDAA